MPVATWLLLFAVGVAVSLAASWLLVSRLERLGERAGFSEAWLGLVAAVAADVPEITSAVTALARGQPSVGAGVVMGSNVFNLAALLGLAAVVAGRIAFRRRVVLLAGLPGAWIAAVCVLTVAAVIPPAAGLALAAAVLVPYIAVLGMRRPRIERLRIPARWARWLAAAVHEEDAELAEAIRPRRGTWRDAVAAAAALVTVAGASTLMEVAATTLGRRYAVADMVTGALVLAVVTSLPNAVTAVYLARKGRGAAVLSTALNSNAINATAGLLVPASLTGLGPASGQDILVAGWYAGLTVLALAYAYRGRGLGRMPGAAIITGYLAFVSALAVSVTHGHVGPAAAILPAVITAVALPLMHVAHRVTVVRPAAAAGLDQPWQRQSLMRGWSVGRVWGLSFLLCAAIAVCDAASGPHLLLVGLLIVGPCCALLTARWVPTAAAGCLALGLAVLVSIPDQIFATITQYAFLAALAVVSLTAVFGAAALQRHRP